jgi:hypothetical protein
MYGVQLFLAKRRKSAATERLKLQHPEMGMVLDEVPREASQNCCLAHTEMGRGLYKAKRRSHQKSWTEFEGVNPLNWYLGSH